MVHGTWSNPVRFKGQDYHKLHKTHQKQKTLFFDPTFPDIDASVGNFENLPPIEWKRPPDLCSSPRLFNEDTSAPRTVVAGKCSSPWFVSACSMLAGIGELLQKVIPHSTKQEWNPEQNNYAGIFHFRFWRYGEWVDVVIDDWLPTFENELLVTHTANQNEFWVSLLEKAYAKLHGSYDALVGGHLADALVDFTGGASEVKDMKTENYDSMEAQLQLYSLLSAEINNSSILCATNTVSKDENAGARTDVGLYRGRPYGITSVKKIALGETNLRTLFRGQDKIPMVKLWETHLPNPAPSWTDPSGKSANQPSSPPENYAYSTSKLTRLLSKNPEWAKIQDSEKHRIGLVCDDELEFWMPLEDFVNQFTELTIIRMFNTSIFTLSKTWVESSVRGKWTVGLKGSRTDKAGGSFSYGPTFLNNPQYIFDIKYAEQKVIFQMLQWDVDNPRAGLPQLLIAFCVIKVEDNRKYRIHKLYDHQPVVINQDPIRRRELFFFGRLTRGRYILIPTSHKPEEEGDFVVRAFSTAEISFRPVKRDTPRTHLFCCTKGYPTCVTVIHIKGAEGLKKFDRIGSCDGYCKIKCGRKSCRTVVIRNSLNPVWDSAFIFYRRKMWEPIIIQVYSHNSFLPDQFAGQVVVPAPPNEQPTVLHAPLMDKKSPEAEPTEGFLNFSFYTSEDFYSL